MSSFPTFTMGLSVTIDGAQEFSAYLSAVGKRMARQELLPILKEAMGPVVESEKSILGPHSKTGLLASSLAVRGGVKDRPDTISVYSRPQATRKQIIKRYSRGRRQQQVWAVTEAGRDWRGRKTVFYGVFVHQGHRFVKRNAAGELYDTGNVAEAVPFATESMPALEEAGAVAAEKIQNFIVGE